MILFKNLNQILTLDIAHQKDGRHLFEQDLGLINHAAVVFDQDKIIWVGSCNDVPQNLKIDQSFDLKGHVLTPEIVDSHTHLVFAGNRADEYTMRLNGHDYQDIARAGGGILATTIATREASFETLFETGKKRIEAIHTYGVGTIEIKSGYALTFDGEKLVAEVIDALKKHFSPHVNIVRTSMAAHALPKEYSNTADYMHEVVLPLLDELTTEGLIDQADIFHEKGYFNDDDLDQFIQSCKKLNLPFKLHADEFNDNGGAISAASNQALSADHLLSSKKESLISLAQSDCVATLLPGTGFFLGKKQADAQTLLQAGAKVAIASDFNPGSCHMDNLLLCASLSAPIYKMNLTQLWAAITLNSSHALGLRSQGAIKQGLAPRFSLFKCEQLSEITYSWGKNLATRLPHLNF